MSVDAIEITHVPALEYLLGLVCSRTGVKMYTKDVESADVYKIDSYSYGILINTKDFIKPFEFSISDKEFTMMSTFGTDWEGKIPGGSKSVHKEKVNTEYNGMRFVEPENLPKVTKFLINEEEEYCTVTNNGHKFVHSIAYEFDFDGPAPKRFRIIVEHDRLMKGPKGAPPLPKLKSTIYVDGNTYATIVQINGRVMNPIYAPIVNRGHVQPIRCSVSGEKIPRMIPTRYYDANTLKAFAESTFALKCQCREGFFCPNIMESVNRGTDFRSWLPKVDTPTGSDKLPVTFFYLAVPVFGHILYSFRIKYSVSKDWEGHNQGKLMAFGITEDETFFYDAPRSNVSGDGEKLTIVKDSIQYIEQFYNGICGSQDMGKRLESFFNGTPVPCKQKSHNYGTTNRIQQLINGPTISETEKHLKALILSLELYDMCHLCYTNANPAFSLIPDLS